MLKVNDTASSMFMLEKYGINLKHISMEDTPDYDISIETELLPCLEYIDQGLRQGKNTLVICTAGMSRSATVCIAYLMSRQKMTYQDAFNEVKRARRFIKPNVGFIKFL